MADLSIWTITKNYARYTPRPDGLRRAAELLWDAEDRMRRTLIALGIAAIFACAPVFAHHSFAAEFDINKPITLSGTVTKVEWVNPHVYIYLDVKDASGKVTPWSLSSFSPARVTPARRELRSPAGPARSSRRAGVTRASFGQGQQVT